MCFWHFLKENDPKIDTFVGLLHIFVSFCVHQHLLVHKCTKYEVSIPKHVCFRGELQKSHVFGTFLREMTQKRHQCFTYTLLYNTVLISILKYTSVPNMKFLSLSMSVSGANYRNHTFLAIFKENAPKQGEGSICHFGNMDF